MGTTLTRRTAVAAILGAAATPAQAQIALLTMGSGIATPSPPKMAEPTPQQAIATPLVRLSPADLMAFDAGAARTDLGLPDTRGLWLQNPNTHEEVSVLFFERGKILNTGYTQICKIMRDWREDQVMAMSPLLIHLLWQVQRGVRYSRPLIITSGFRTMRTNQSLASEGAAPDSYHMRSSACDVILDGVEPAKIATYVHAMQRGGVGFYSRFTHIDTGPVRTWRG
jgi:uncharacterized protein YcbK (DUF882 family)